MYSVENFQLCTRQRLRHPRDVLQEASRTCQITQSNIRHETDPQLSQSMKTNSDHYIMSDSATQEEVPETSLLNRKEKWSRGLRNYNNGIVSLHPVATTLFGREFSWNSDKLSFP